MLAPIDLLEKRVSAAADLIASLRRKVLALEQSFADARNIPASPPSPSLSSESRRIAAENARLREERALIRESIRSLIREIDQTGG